MVLATAYDGELAVVIRPDQLGQFVVAHTDLEWVFQNVGFDYHVIRAALDESHWLASAVDRGQFHDTMLLDQLVRLGLGRGADAIEMRDLAKVAWDWAKIKVDKDDKHRKRYDEIGGREDEWPGLDCAWFDYPVGDVVGTYHSYLELVRQAQTIWSRLSIAGDLAQRLTDQFGLLSERIQVGAAVALSDCTRRGFAVDPNQAKAVEGNLRGEVDLLVEWFKYEHPTLLTYTGGAGRAARVQTTPTGVPSLKRSGLLDVLSRIERENGLTLPRTEKTGVLTTAFEDWKHVKHPFVSKWSRLVELSKLLTFMEKLRRPIKTANLFESAEDVGPTGTGPYRDAVRSRYTVIVRTGRTSSNDPNGQNWPKDGWFRGMFVARPGRTLVVADYSAIELVTLAAVCLKRYGYSKLGDIIRAGGDPHANTAASVNGIDDWADFSGREPHRAKKLRQSAKPINFGVPGGLGAEHLASYALHEYGVTLSPDDAVRWRKGFLAAYPEVAEYLADRSMNTLARNLGCPVGKLWPYTNVDERDRQWLPIVVRKVVAGQPYKKNGQAYASDLVDRVWTRLAEAPINPDLVSAKWIERIRLREGSPTLADRLFRESVTTLTGRVRGSVIYTEARNTPFQGLAGDGGKLALWRLFREGRDIVAFVHDEIVVEVDEAKAEAERDYIVSVMREEMTKAIQCDLPVKVAAEVTKRWSKP